MRQGKNSVFTKVWTESCCRSVDHSYSAVQFAAKQPVFRKKKKKVAENGLELETSSLLTAI